MIFRKAKAVAHLLKQMDYGVDLRCRPTDTGHSAVLRARRVKDHVYIERGFQLLDHENADDPLDLVEFETIVDSDEMPVAKLVKLCLVPNEALDVLAEQIPAPRIITRDEQHAALQVARKGRQDHKEREQAHLQRMDAWIALHCPDFGALTSREKKEVRRRAAQDLYGLRAKAA